MIFDRVIVGGLATNCYILRSGDCGIIIDPGDEAERILKKARGLKIELILATHNHFDHITALSAVKEKTGARAAIHPNDWTDGFDERLEDGERIRFGDDELLVIHTPGHTPGGCCFLVGGDLFSGDTLFPGGPGNTSFPGGDEAAIYQSIRTKLMVLPDGVRVHPGHGPSTTIGAERHLY
ncbi:MBL fold metallo-hydrolase [candidate division WOR-3 bacterium]|uniref:MBL fold metallo-hydrolase n=1 Tax=candidate division WOR-3 bacterium TaxID=2052148 RepID=A0A660SKH5_UNCW3|nr:MAG: MBL fold metallo-hydrolase [candidate division WOR-3 bacterium]